MSEKNRRIDTTYINLDTDRVYKNRSFYSKYTSSDCAHLTDA